MRECRAQDIDDELILAGVFSASREPDGFIEVGRQPESDLARFEHAGRSHEIGRRDCRGVFVGVEQFGLAGGRLMKVAQVFLGKTVLQDLDIAQVILDELLNVSAPSHAAQMARYPRGCHGETAFAYKFDGGIPFEPEPHSLNDTFLFGVSHS